MDWEPLRGDGQTFVRDASDLEVENVATLSIAT